MQPNERLPAVSIITPTYNHADKLKVCIESVVAQTFKDWEMIIVNNYSDDHTIEVVERFRDARIKLINFRNHGIIAASRNTAIRLARGELIAFLDSDDWWYSEKLAHACRAMKTADLCYHDLKLERGGQGQLVCRRTLRGRTLRKPIFRNLLLSNSPLYNSGVTTRRCLIEKAGYLSEDREMVGAEDTDLWLKIARLTENFKYIPKVLGVYWEGGGNMTEASYRQIKRITFLFEKHLQFLPVKERLRAVQLLRYSIGRIFQKMGEYSNALRQFKHSVHSDDALIMSKSAIATVSVWTDIVRRFVIENLNG